MERNPQTERPRRNTHLQLTGGKLAAILLLLILAHYLWFARPQPLPALYGGKPVACVDLVRDFVRSGDGAVVQSDASLFTEDSRAAAAFLDVLRDTRFHRRVNWGDVFFGSVWPNAVGSDGIVTMRLYVSFRKERERSGALDMIGIECDSNGHLYVDGAPYGAGWFGKRDAKRLCAQLEQFFLQTKGDAAWQYTERPESTAAFSYDPTSVDHLMELFDKERLTYEDGAWERAAACAEAYRPGHLTKAEPIVSIRPFFESGNWEFTTQRLQIDGKTCYILTEETNGGTQYLYYLREDDAIAFDEADSSAVSFTDTLNAVYRDITRQAEKAGYYIAGWLDMGSDYAPLLWAVCGDEDGAFYLYRCDPAGDSGFLSYEAFCAGVDRYVETCAKDPIYGGPMWLSETARAQ